MDLKRLRAELINDLDMGPSCSSDHGLDATFAHAEASAQFREGRSRLIQPSDFTDLFIGQLRCSASRLSLRSLLKSDRIRVSHLLAHRHHFKVCGAIVTFSAVLMIHRHSRRNLANEGLVHQSVQQHSPRSEPSLPEPNRSVTQSRRLPFQDARPPTFVSSQAANVAAIAYLVQPFKSSHRDPHGHLIS